MNSALIYFSSFFFLTIFSFMNVSLNGTYIARTFYEMPPSVVKSAVYPLNTSNQYAPHFDKTKLKNVVIEYLDRNLESKIDKYKIGFIFMKYEDGLYSISYGNNANAVEIKFNCKYGKVLTFTGNINYTIEGVYANGWEPNWFYWK